MIRLLNSAMMPAPGIYRMKSVSRGEFIEAVRLSYQAGQLRSYIGYPQNAALVSEWAGISEEGLLNRSQTVIDDGDVLLVMKLRYRPEAPTKGQAVDPEDFEFFRVEYQTS